MVDRETDVAMSHQGRRSPEEADFTRRLGESLRAYRVSAGLTQAELANQAELTRGSIANIERGIQSPQIFRLALLARALNIDVNDLIPSIHEIDQSVLPDYSRDAYASVLHLARQQQRHA